MIRINAKLAAILVFSFSLNNHASAAALIDPALQKFAQRRGPKHQRVLFLVDSSSQPQIVRPQRYDRPAVIRYYHDVSKAALMPVFESVQNHKLDGVKIIKPYWVNASALADVTPEGLKLLAQHPAVTKIYLDRLVASEPVKRGGPANVGLPTLEGQKVRAAQSVQQISAAFQSMGLDKVIKEMPQVTGQGVIVGVEDSGVDGAHLALAGKVGIFFSGKTHSTGPAQEFDPLTGHGTHVCGTIAGGNRQDNFIGVAPGAKLAVAGTVIDGDEDAVFDTELDGMQWFLDLDNNKVVATRVKVVNNSWHSEGAPDQELFYRALAAWEAAGILPIFSAGNHGTPRSISPPHEYPGTFAVGSFDEHGNVAQGSSLGPGVYKGKDEPKPDISAPGVSILSAKSGGGYHALTGTSMATPHVSGVAALLLQLRPDLNPQQLRTLLIDGATPGTGMVKGKWDAGFGYGQLNAYNSIKLLMRNETLNFTNSLSLVLGSSAEDIANEEFGRLSMGEVNGDVDQYQTDESRWLKLSDL